MQVKTTPTLPALVFSTKTTLNEISQFVATVAKDLYAEAARQQLLPSGPLHWVYAGADGKPDTTFLLEIALPVAGIPAQQSSFIYKELPRFECIAVHHYGAWEHLYETYDRLMDDVFARGRKPSGFCREQYLYMDFANPSNNITEVQVGIC